MNLLCNNLYDFTDARIESILAQQYSFFGFEKYPSVFQKAAMLFYFFTKGHCFVDGNKRVGIQSAFIFLEINGYLEMLNDDEGIQKTFEVEAQSLSEIERDKYIDSLAIWLSQRVIKLPQTS